MESICPVYLDFPDTQQILLEQNYRSTGAILATSIAIVSQGTPFRHEFFVPWHS